MNIRTMSQLQDFAELARVYQLARGNMQYRAIDAINYSRDPDICRNMEQFTCRHDWVVNEETDRCYCLNCGMDGDA